MYFSYIVYRYTDVNRLVKKKFLRAFACPVEAVTYSDDLPVSTFIHHTIEVVVNY